LGGSVCRTLRTWGLAKPSQSNGLLDGCASHFLKPCLRSGSFESPSFARSYLGGLEAAEGVIL
jgi:hypothetical protein